MFYRNNEVVDVVVASGRRRLCRRNVRMVYFEYLVSPSDSHVGWCRFSHSCDCVCCVWLAVGEGGMMPRIITVSFVRFANIWFCSLYVVE